jgi:hypothetical protein
MGVLPMIAVMSGEIRGIEVSSCDKWGKARLFDLIFARVEDEKN